MSDTRDRNAVIYDEVLAGSPYAVLASRFDISTNRVGQIYHQQRRMRRHPKYTDIQMRCVALAPLCLSTHTLSALTHAGIETIDEARRVVIEGVKIRNFGIKGRLELATALLKHHEEGNHDQP